MEKKYTSQEIKEFVSKTSFDKKVLLNKDSSYPKISIVTPSYNQAEFLERTILSVLSQNYPNLEYIIMDGDSKDGSMEIIKKYEKYLAYWVSKPDSGQSNALNEGFKKATGDIYGWLNSDDELLPGALFTVARIYIETKADFIYGDRIRIDEKGNSIGIDILPKMHPYCYMFYTQSALYQESCFWSSKLHSKTGIIDENLHFSMDYDWLIRLTSKVKNYYYIRLPLGCIRIHRNQKGALLRTDRNQKELENNPYIKEAIEWRPNYLRKNKISKFKLFFGFIFYYYLGKLHKSYMKGKMRIRTFLPRYPIKLLLYMIGLRDSWL